MQVALLAFGPGVFKPSEQTLAIVKQCVSKARHGKVPQAATKAYAWMSSPDYPLPLAYEVDLRIIGSAILGASLVSYLLKVRKHPESFLDVASPGAYLGAWPGSAMWQVAATAHDALAATCYTLGGLDTTACHSFCCSQCHDGFSDACPSASRLSHSIPALHSSLKGGQAYCACVWFHLHSFRASLYQCRGQLLRGR